MDAATRTKLNIGCLVTNLQSLEFVLRLMLESVDRDIGEASMSVTLPFLSPNDHVPEAPMTDYDSLRALVEKANRVLKSRDIPHRVDPRVVELRDALAHGRVLCLRPDPPFSVVKFGKPHGGRVRVVARYDMTEEWFKEEIERTFRELDGAIVAARKMGLTCFPCE